MRTICLNQLSWRSYTSLCTMISACIGFVLGILLFLLVYIVHVDFSIRFGSFYINGELFSIVAVFVGPFVGAGVGLVGSLLTHPLFALVLAWFSGVPLTGEWLDSEQCKANE